MPIPDQDYAVLFEQMPGGQQVLAELVNKFGNNPYVAGGHDGDRQTAFNAGQLSVVSFILDRINNAHSAHNNRGK
ncbi:hypothetical protein BEE12_16055 [Pantoea agglomerans]|uniref:Bbp19 family protein n=1 Tax=Enterobacter agglomerans TaxID=549 RepID=UPI00083D1C1D|nr:hypothetical protein [Pantoea agglomerans]AOE41970.1 hypothetical protein BEE12_16055 [Pantoea agglomerans]